MVAGAEPVAGISLVQMERIEALSAVVATGSGQLWVVAVAILAAEFFIDDDEFCHNIDMDYYRSVDYHFGDEIQRSTNSENR